jgi:hypothetical protein
MVTVWNAMVHRGNTAFPGVSMDVCTFITFTSSCDMIEFEQHATRKIIPARLPGPWFASQASVHSYYSNDPRACYMMGVNSFHGALAAFKTGRMVSLQGSPTKPNLSRGTNIDRHSGGSSLRYKY